MHTSIRCVCVVLCTTSAVSVMLATPGVSPRRTPGYVRPLEGPGEESFRRQQLRNYYDVSYMGEITVGGQVIETVLDSGSFELAVLAHRCRICGSNRSLLYNCQNSASYVELPFKADCTYASGIAYTLGSYDDVSIEGLNVSQEFFWQIYDADDALGRIFKEDSFAAVLGVGPPRSVLAFAEHELQSAQNAVEAFQRKGGRVTDKMMSVVRTYQEKIQLAASNRPLLTAMGVRDMSVCFGRASGSPGYFMWHDRSAFHYPSLFTEVPVLGDFYWSAALTDVSFDSMPYELQSDLSGANPYQLGCVQERCSAVFDTGSSVIGVPSHVAFELDNILYDWSNKGGGCDDVSMLPNLEFKLAGKSFVLPPESYVARFSGSAESFERVKEFLPMLHNQYLAKADTETHPELNRTFCASVFSPVGATSQFGPVWIFGASFFRQYYTSFHLVPSEMSGDLTASSISFARANQDCRPEGSDAEGETLMRLSPALDGRKREAQLNLDVSKLRLSSIISRFDAPLKKLNLDQPGPTLLRMPLVTAAASPLTYVHI